MNKQTTTPDPSKLSFLKRGNYWPLIIVGMLVFHASIMIGTIVIVTARHDLYVESDYYAKSVDWDTLREMLEKSDEMGWDVKLSLSDPAADQSRTLTIIMHDRNGDSIDRASVNVESFHPAHANDRISAVLIGQGEGAYSKSVSMITPGFWQAIISVQYQGSSAMIKREIEIK